MIVMGAPVVNPSNTPLSISGWSGSLLFVVPVLPLCRLLRSAIKSSGCICIPGGQPSILTPIAGPCDSPNSETLKIIPYEFISIYFLSLNLL